MCEKENFKPWSITEVIFENGPFVHANLGSFLIKLVMNKPN